MNGRRLLTVTARTAEQLPSATLTQPIGPDYDVFKVAGKVFVMTTRVRGVDIATLKCEPPRALALSRDYPEITPGYHMNKRHWISIAPGPDIDEHLVEDLVVGAYELVVDGLPRSRRPV
ncbi:cytoplasmic protein (plasmid) [Mycobacterium sp. MS1601]|jgi:predicted DNA-binding protein (MmcQ/YjbR family)|uniref:MmcQ/YjbR family DNA-binding protein n=1 Tax=Mycobacterium sp. MS1601 TaxID=1936029 RepID=UPI00097948B5|nr:MmcQ/YjbR family DNA-binding protein [Mycobacterium sp. MS1601]AQA07167.1 cytoplasmic protein [Mycobacterium sp. MS1601]